MSITRVSILFAAALLFAGCTVHHYHHKAAAGHGKKMHGHHGKSGYHSSAVPKGHPPIAKGKGHGMKGHGMKGHGMKGHGMKGHGMKGHGAKGHSSMQCQHGKPSAHHGHGAAHKHGNQPAEIVAFHDSFAAAWHKDGDGARRDAACASVPEWKKLALAVKKLGGGIVLDAATKDLHQKTLAVGTACASEKGDVQAALVTAHDALHMLFKVADKPAAPRP